jgi:sortase A
VIPRIGLDIPVKPVGLVDVKKGGTSIEAWDTAPDAGAYHNTTALPGHPGNTVINGHRDTHAAVFWKLNKLRRGDEIILFVEDATYRYGVAEARKVRYVGASDEEHSEHQRLIGYFPEERLTLVTCAPVGLATHRLYVVARPAAQLGAAGENVATY